MGIIGGPNIIKNGLVLHLDAANIKSFRGEPTTNIITNGDFSNGTTNWSPYSTTTISVPTVLSFPLSLGRVKTVLNCITRATLHGGGNYGGIARSITMTAGITYTISYYARSLSGDMLLHSNFQSGTGDSNNMSHIRVINSQWALYTHTVTLNIAKPTMYFWNANLPSGIFQITNIQIEEKAYNTPFTNGSRGTTVATGGGWKDISGSNNNGELLNGVRYNSGNLGNLIFDGVDDSITIPFNASTMDFSLAQTIIMWLKPDVGANSVRRNPYNQAYGGSGTITHELSGVFNYFFGTNGGNNVPYVGKSSSFTVVSNELAFIAVTRSQSLNICRWYKNGIRFVNTDAGGYATTNNGNSPILIGTGYTNSFIGNIYYVSVYNRFMDDTQILEIYNATKGRFGL